MIRNSFSHSFSSYFLYCADFCSVFARADLLTVIVFYSLCLAQLTIGSNYNKYCCFWKLWVYVIYVKFCQLYTKLPPKIQFFSKFCVKYININVLSQLNVTTSLKYKYEKCCFFVYCCGFSFLCFSESKYVKCFTLNC